MNVIKRLTISLIFHVSCLCVELLAFVFPISLVIWGLIQLPPMLKMMLAHRAEFLLDTPVVNLNIADFCMSLIPISFITAVVIIAVILGINILHYSHSVPQELWAKIPEKIKGRDFKIPTPKWANAKNPYFVIPLVSIMAMITIVSFSLIGYLQLNWSWWVGGLIAFGAIIFESSIIMYFVIRARNKKLKEKKDD